ncbi:ATP-dependent DNA helicase RecQ [Leucoagaricus sp. SymC.cos]|nr:ATP-dependent DNA helicase RecQ [Leucoagaricus sp. SymC.cos]
MASKSRRTWRGLQANELQDIETQIQEKFQWEHTPRPFQVEAIKAILQRKDVLIHAGTGMGKTAVAAGAFAVTQTEGMVAFVVSPLIVLQQEQMVTFQEEFRLRAIAVNSSGANQCTAEIMKKKSQEICRGRWQIVIISPELLLSKKFILNVIRSSELSSRMLAVLVDECHVISHWGSGFRKEYGRLGILRALLPKSVPFVAMSATMPFRVRKDILTKLHINEDTLTDLDMGNDRQNVSLVVRPIHNTMNSYSDLAFVIPEDLSNANSIKKAFIYADNIADGYGIQQYLESRLPETLKATGLIRPYSGGYSDVHRSRVMELFKRGVIRVLICTDAAGMGCNIPDINLVVQWKLPATVSSFIQRAGRAARGLGRKGLAVLLVEKSVYNADLSKASEAKQALGKGQKKPSIRQSSIYTRGNKMYAALHGVHRGTHDGAYDNDKLDEVEVFLDRDSIDEGLYSLVQAVKCRRAVIKSIYGNRNIGE